MRPAAEYLKSYREALERGFQPSNHEGEARRLASLDQIEADPQGFLAQFEDGSSEGPPISLPDGTEAPRLPDLTRWIWDDDFCGVISLRWQEGTDTLPPHVLGHVGYVIAEWKRRRGYASGALAAILPLARQQGLRRIEVAASDENPGSWKVIEKAGGVLTGTSTGMIYHRNDEVLRFYRIDL
ncbi:MAG: GNAT family N-acetyltransferase [Erythrobacter sp.]